MKKVELDMTFPSRQKGISLFLALIALVVLSLAAIALFRSVDTGSLVAGNIAFKQATTAAANRTAEQAINWLQTNNTGGSLFEDKANSGYYATALQVDPTGNSSSEVAVDWNGDNCENVGTASSCLKPVTWAVTSTTDLLGSFKNQYVITRMCKIAGDPNVSNTCSKAVITADGASPKRGELKYGDNVRFATPSGPYYRILVRTAGPKDTVSYTETYVYF